MKMKLSLVFLFFTIHNANCAKQKTPSKTVPEEQIKKDLEKYEEHLLSISKNKTKSNPFVVTNDGLEYVKPVEPEKEVKIMITPDVVQGWANIISKKLIVTEEYVVRRKELLDGFVNVKAGVRDGAAIAEKAATAFTELLKKRAAAAEAIMRKAEQIQSKEKAPKRYKFHYSYRLGENKLVPTKPSDITWTHVRLLKCRAQGYVPLQPSAHFDADVTLDLSSVHVSAEVFDCDPRVRRDLYWSEQLLSTFRDNYRQDASLGFQYFCSASGFLRHYPAASWESMFKLPIEEAEDGESVDGVYDCRLRPWYVSAGGAPRDILVMMDASGSMYNSSNKVIAEQFTLALLNALTDDDQVNVLRFNVTIKSAIPCFEDKLIPANHINTAAIMSTMKYQSCKNATNMTRVLRKAITMLLEQRNQPDRRPPCQQAIVLITDTLNENVTELVRQLDPDGTIRLFVIWLHDRYGVRDYSHKYSDQLSCTTDAYFAELLTAADVTEQVLRVLRVLERPLVLQRNERPVVYSDVYAHVEDPRRSEYFWTLKENAEQLYRYTQLRHDKNKLLNSSQPYKDYMHEISLDQYGQYYEGIDVNYRMQISVSVPVFESTTSENVSIYLDEELKRRATRTYPVNRLLGVAGVDIPIDHLKLLLPFYQVGAGGSMFIVDHRGNIVLHENLKPTFDGNLLKPGYRTVDFLDLEQSAQNHLPREYIPKWFKFRNKVIIDLPQGTETLLGKHVFEDGMRATVGEIEYSWRRVLDHYTVVVALPRRHRDHSVPLVTKFTQALAAEAVEALSDPDFTVHPDWLYCRYVHKTFDPPEEELLTFLRRRSSDPNFPMKNLEHVFFASSHEGTFDMARTYQCNEELMAWVSEDARATAQWARRHETPGVLTSCPYCDFGSVTAFVATVGPHKNRYSENDTTVNTLPESGLTRWQQYHASSAHAEPPSGAHWPRAAAEPWYARAAAAPPLLAVHAPVAPARLMRNSDAAPTPIGERSKWLTAARVLEQPGKGIVGVTGFHFHPRHLEDILKTVTDFPYAEDDDAQHATCNGVDWSCLVIDDGGWVVAGGSEDSAEEPVRQHLATLHPAAMAALLEANVFELNWIHDYQAVCFPPVEENVESAGPVMPSILRSVWIAMKAIIHATSEAVTIMMLTNYGPTASAETAAEKDKRRRAIKKNFEREKFERLYDERVLVNRTRIAACDRSRPLYVLHRGRAAEQFKRAASQHSCRWPLVGALVPGTNLVLLAVFTPCPLVGRALPSDPMVNVKVNLSEEINPKTMQKRQPAAATLACWRNRVPLPARPPHVQCFDHEYEKEEGYRQCGPWVPDAIQPDEDEDDVDYDDYYDDEAAYAVSLSKLLLYLPFITWMGRL